MKSMNSQINSSYSKQNRISNINNNDPPATITWRYFQTLDYQKDLNNNPRVQATIPSASTTSTSSQFFSPITANTSKYTTISPPTDDIVFSESDISTLKTKDTHDFNCHPYCESSSYPNSDKSQNTEHSSITLVPSQTLKIEFQEASKDQENHPVAPDCSLANIEQNNITNIAVVKGNIRNETSSYSSNVLLGSSTTRNNSNSECIANKDIARNNKGNIVGNNHNGSEMSKSQKPVVPRIIVPDGCSINLSTPPTTPRQHSRTYNFSQPSVWSHNLTQILERLGSRRAWNTTSQGRQTSFNYEASQQQPWPYGATRSIQHDPIRDLLNTSDSQGCNNLSMKGHEPTGSEDSLEQVLSHNRVMGVPLHGYRSQSLSTDGKEDWFEEEEETPGSYFSHTRWSYLCCTKPGLLKTFKHSLTVIFGLFTIIAIGITASGKFRNRSRVSDYIPTNLTNAIMEAQVVVIKDFDRFQRSKRDYGQQLNSFNPLISRRDSVDSQSESRIPIWTGPVHTHCLHEKCDIEHFGEKYFAFIHAESFGISLDKNWPSLCNSCIEISINRFVYNTKVRILGDLLLCPAGQSETTESNPSSHLTELAAISPLPTRASNTNATSNTTTATMTTTATHTLTAKTPGHEIPVASTKRHKFSSERPKYPLSSSNSIPSSTLTKDPKPSDLKPREQIEGSKMSSRRMYRQGNDHTKKGHQKQHMMARNQLSHRDLIAQFGSSTSALPYLIVDPATFTNLTVFEAQEELQKLKFLRVHFRFVLCDV